MADARWWIYYCSKSKNYTTTYALAQTRNLCRYSMSLSFWLSWFVQFHEKCVQIVHQLVLLRLHLCFHGYLWPDNRGDGWISRWWLGRGSWMTSRNSLKLRGKANCWIQAYPCIICWSFIPGLFTTKSWLVVACCCSFQLSLSQWKSLSSKAESCKSLSPSREIIRYGADPLCSRSTAMITHVFIAGFRTNIDTVSVQCASNGDLPHSADTCIFFREEYQHMSTKTVQIELKPR